MALSAKLQLRQTQSLVMTPQLLQSIRLLQYSQSELSSFIEAEIERNPLLEAGGAGAPVQPADGLDPPPPASLAASESPLTGRAEHDEAFADGLAARLEDVSPGAAHAGEGASHGPGPAAPDTRLRDASAGGAFDGSVEDFAEGRPSLLAHALAEIADLLSDPVERRLAESLAAHLDEAGYLRFEAAELDALGVNPARAEAMLARLQAEAEPAGLFARDLAECLAIQLKRLNRYDPVMAAILDNLDLLARRDFASLKRLTGEDDEGLLEALSEIRRLDPKPGHAFASDPGEAVVPDVVVEEAPEGGWRVELNPEALPRVLVRGDYAETVLAGQGAAPREEDRAWLAERQQSAQWLVRSLDQRARTILKVAVEIARRQDGFLAHGLSALKPMTLAAVAQAIGMHESTVSRVTNNKYVATPRGTFEMKFFFTNAIPATGGGDAHSAEAVKLRIRLMIEGERDGRVLSDDEIAEKLAEDGVEVARRTVAKYREGMGIASSIQRRREMKARRLAS
ncbi:RNA polymerase factor sigma-54 [Antarcticirhabdus aurantiaca]|uniref:RNA polymerase factor sigma-54 n=1 Tax=Antarcticirhabdus aurantiaca TaxID=2606717 RepID=A0ACD4NQH4_9HYPH|nr:RNA polymerase factor sigma-54 [Antarcticirhabdus aurantiaca]WAJ29026.1 RNA polymerase factor sigma-54 [Jeongeuplla avenae]